MEIQLYKTLDNYPHLSYELRDLVVRCDSEFFPPLSGRTSTQQTDMASVDNTTEYSSPEKYSSTLLQQLNIIAINDGVLVGFMSFIHSYTNELFTSFSTAANNYITTICIAPNFRRLGICNAFYEFIEHRLPCDVRTETVSTRTWSLNKGHIALLQKRGYSTISVIPNHRKYNNIVADTLYFAKSVSNN